MLSRNSLRQLRRADGSPPKFHDRLGDVLCGEEYKQWVSNPDGEDLVWLVDYLDKALNNLDPASPGFRKCLHELRHICGTRMMLPTSYTHPSSLIDIGRQPVASGGSGDLYQATLDGSKVCVKRIRVYSKDGPGQAIRALYQEAVVWKHLKHRNVVPFLGVTYTPLQLISEWMPGGVLTEYIKNHPDADRLSLAGLSDVAKGLRFLHSRNIVHGDLKGPNILVNAAGRARIGDFGQTMVVIQNLDHIRSTSSHLGHTARWTAPEILNEKGTYSKEADVFSFAMVMIEVFTGAIPFNDSRPAVATMAIMTDKRPPRPTHPALTDQLWTLVQRCWAQDPRLRPEVSEILEVLLAPDPPAWKRLMSDPLSADECISLTTSIFSNRNKAKMVGYLSGDDAQSFIDVIDKVLDILPSKARKRCLRTLYRICDRQGLLPKSLVIPLCYDPKDVPLGHGGFADVWKGQYRGQDTVAKVLRVCQTSDLDQIKKKFCREVMTWRALRHPNVLPLLGVTMSGTRFVMVSEWMVNGNINEFLKADADANRLELLIEVTKGLIYMHEQGTVHGDLKGANILIDHRGHACLADFSLVTITSDQSTIMSSCREGGTIQWMSPELLDPESFGLTKIRPTKESDCYALGMVVLEVLSGQAPFFPYGSPVVIRKVLYGERPGRPQGENGRLFTDSIWKVLECCWEHRPRDRVNAKAVLLGLEGDSFELRPSSNTKGDEESDTDDRSDTTASDSESPVILEGEISDRRGRSAGKIFKVAVEELRGLWRSVR